MFALVDGAGGTRPCGRAGGGAVRGGCRRGEVRPGRDGGGAGGRTGGRVHLARGAVGRVHAGAPRRGVRPAAGGGGRGPRAPGARASAACRRRSGRACWRGRAARSATYPAGLRVHDLFAAQAARTPRAPALVHAGEVLDYAGLERAANRLANHLRRLGVGPETRVGICLERGPELVVAMLAILKAGGAYVPLDPAYPRERLGYMLEDAGGHAGHHRLDASRTACRRARPGCCCSTWSATRSRRSPPMAPESGVRPENLSHVIFTSGSTGRPEGGDDPPLLGGRPAALAAGERDGRGALVGALLHLDQLRRQRRRGVRHARLGRKAGDRRERAGAGDAGRGGGARQHGPQRGGGAAEAAAASRRA